MASLDPGSSERRWRLIRRRAAAKTAGKGVTLQENSRTHTAMAYEKRTAALWRQRENENSNDRLQSGGVKVAGRAEEGAGRRKKKAGVS